MFELGHETKSKLLNITFKDNYEKITPKIKFTQHFRESKPEEYFKQYPEN